MGNPLYIDVFFCISSPDESGEGGYFIGSTKAARCEYVQHHFYTWMLRLFHADDGAGEQLLGISLEKATGAIY